MRPLPTALLVAALAAHAALVGAWAVYEARQQRHEVESALSEEAKLIARTLGPGLAAANLAASEIDEAITWRILDNARLLVALDQSGAIDEDRLLAVSESNGLDAIVFVGRDGAPRERSLGDLPRELLDEALAVASGEVEETILPSSIESGIDHLAVAVADPRGGAVIVRIHAGAARAFARQIGVANLLRRLVESGGVLYLSFEQAQAAPPIEASWDGGPIPAPTDETGLRDVRGRKAFETAVAVAAPAGTEARLRVGLDGAPLERAVALGLRRTLLVAVALSGLGLLLAALAIISRQRVLEREDAARRLAEAEAARRRSERLAAAGALTAGLAHEVRSPLNAIGLAAQRIERKHEGGDECAEFAARIRGEVRRLEGVLREFLEFARPMSGRFETVDLAAVAREVAGLLASEAEERKVELVVGDGTLAARADREAVHRALVNLVRNAIQASPERGCVRLSWRRQDGWAEIAVADDGPGLEPGLAERLFDAFMTTRPDGTGLGLALVRRVAEEHGGSADLVNRPQGGAEARLRLPIDGGQKR